MITLGLDPSFTGFGWCVHRSDVTGRRRVIAKGQFTTSSKDIFVWRNCFMREAVLQVLDAYPEVEGVGVESPPYGEQYSEGLYGLFVYVNEAMFLRRKDVVYFDPARVKLFAKMDPRVRRGRMDKTDMVEAAKAETKIKRWSHNEADAYIIARSAARFFEFLKGDLQEDELVPAEKSIFTKARTITRGPRKGKVIKKGLIFKEGDRFYLFSKLRPEDTQVSVNFQRQ